jgi:hypothetical protein
MPATERGGHRIEVDRKRDQQAAEQGQAEAIALVLLILLVRSGFHVGPVFLCLGV